MGDIVGGGWHSRLQALAGQVAPLCIVPTSCCVLQDKQLLALTLAAAATVPAAAVVFAVLLSCLFRPNTPPNWLYEVQL